MRSYKRFLRSEILRNPEPREGSGIFEIYSFSFFIFSFLIEILRLPIASVLGLRCNRHKSCSPHSQGTRTKGRYAVGQPLRMGRVRFRLTIRKPTDAIEEQDLRKGNRKRNGKGQKGVPLGEPLEKGDFSSFLFLKVSLSLLLILTFLKHFQKSTQKYTRHVLNSKIEKEPEQG